MQLKRVALRTGRILCDLRYHLLGNRQGKPCVGIRGIRITSHGVCLRKRLPLDIYGNTNITGVADVLSLKIRGQHPVRLGIYSLKVGPSGDAQTSPRSILHLRYDRFGVYCVRIFQCQQRVGNWIQELIDSRHPLLVGSAVMDCAGSSPPLLRVEQHPVKCVLIIPHKCQNHQATLKRPSRERVVAVVSIELPHPLDKSVPELGERARDFPIVIEQVFAEELRVPVVNERGLPRGLDNGLNRARNIHALDKIVDTRLVLRDRRSVVAQAPPVDAVFKEIERGSFCKHFRRTFLVLIENTLRKFSYIFVP